MPRNNPKASPLPDVLSLSAQSAQPDAPMPGDVSLYTRRRAGYDFLEILRETGRNIAMQPHMGVNRIGLWSPNSGTSVTTLGMPLASSGTVSHLTPSAGGLWTASRRFRVASAATAGQAADARGTTPFMWRGNAAKRGGFISILRFTVAALAAGANGFFGLDNSSSALAVHDVTTAKTQEMVGVGFKNGAHANMQLVYKGAGNTAPIAVDLGPDFPVTQGAVLSLYIFSPVNGAFIAVRIVNEETGAAAEYTLANNIPADATFLTPRLHLDNAAAAAAVSFDCYGVYCETDY